MLYKKHLYKDSKLVKIIGDETFDLSLQKNIPLRLMRSIMGQQLNIKVAQIIYDRFIDLYNGKEPTPKQVLNTRPETLKAIGLSNAKVNYILNVAQFCIENKVNDSKLIKLTNKEIIDLLTKIKGVGGWTVEMLLIFSLAREDVFSVDDLGIQKAMIILYKIDSSNKPAMKLRMIEISKKWSPFSTYACLHLWAWKDKKEVT